MTRADFLKEFGADFKKLANKPMFDALLQTIDTESPAKQFGRADGDRLHGAEVYLNEIYGWERLRAFLVGLSTSPDEPFEPEDKFSQPETV